MAIIKDAKLDALFTSANASFEKGKPTAPNHYEKIATVVTSDSDSETYHWLGKFPKLKEWIGERTLKNIASHGYIIQNKTYESSVNVSVDDLNDDKFGVYAPLFSEMGLEATVYPNRYIFELLKKGFENTCYDGQYFFDTDHPVGAGVFSNTEAPDTPTGDETPWFVLDTRRALKPLIFQRRENPILKQLDYRLDSHNEMIYGIKARFSAGYGFPQMAFASTKELTADNLKNAISKMKSFKDEEGNPLGINPNVLVVAPNMEWIAKDLLEMQITTSMNGTKSNVLYKALEVFSSEWLA
jgi:phage major head subunit gpT-like protein